MELTEGDHHNTLGLFVPALEPSHQRHLFYLYFPLFNSYGSAESRPASEG